MKFHHAARLGLVVTLATMLGGCWDTSETVDKKINDAFARVQQTPAAPEAPAPGNAKAVVNCGNIKVNASAGGSSPDVNVSIEGCNKPCENDCQPRVVPPTFYERPVVPPAPQEYRKGPLVRPAPRVYRPAPAARIAEVCYVRVDLLEADKVTPYRKAMPLDVTDKAGRVFRSLTLKPGYNRVAVPCDGRREICLTIVGTKNKKRTEYLEPGWFASRRGNLSSGRVFNPDDPVRFFSRS